MDTDKSIDLPSEVIEVILSKSHVKSVVRFKSVSKSWHSIISDPRFSRIHRIQRSKLSENHNMFLVWAMPKLQNQPGEGSIYLVRLVDGKFRTESPLEYQSQIFFLSSCSCNGIFLSRARSDSNNHDYMLWNPSIKTHVMIRGNTDHHPHLRHLYHDSTADDYKIVFVYKKDYAVYSCKNVSWSEMKDLPCDLSLINRGGASVDGCFYGLCNGEVVCFDAREGEVEMFRQPNDVKGEVELEVVSGRLCLYSLIDHTKLQLWVMEKRGNFEKGWRKMMSMEKEEADLLSLRPVGFTNEDNVVLRVREGEVLSWEHVIYNPRENSFQKIEFSWNCISRFFTYEENLYLPSSNILV